MSPRSVPVGEHVFSLPCGLLYPAPRCLPPPGRVPTPLQALPTEEGAGWVARGMQSSIPACHRRIGGKASPTSLWKQLSPGFSAEPALESN